MNYLLSFTPTKETLIAKLKDLLKALLKIWFENISKEMSPSFKKNYNVWKHFLIKDRRACVKPLKVDYRPFKNLSPQLQSKVVEALQA